MQILMAHGGQYVSAIFQWDIPTLRHMVEVLGPEMLEHRAIVRRDLVYPFFITEDARGFHIFARSEISTELSRLKWSETGADDGHCYADLYLIAEDFRPPRASVNMMGLLPQCRVTNRSLSRIEQHGVDAVCRA